MKTPQDLANRARERLHDGFLRESFTLSRTDARAKAAEFFRSYPKQAYMTAVDNWRELPDDRIEFTMKRLPSSD